MLSAPFSLIQRQCTPTLSLGERVNRFPRGGLSRVQGFQSRDARCSLSFGERVRVRGNGANGANGANERIEFRTIPGAHELEEFSGQPKASHHE